MSTWWKVQPPPFRFLLYTEWVMLASCASLAVVEALEKKSLPVPHFLILAMLALMGLRLPSGKTLIKVFYTGIEIGLIFGGTMLGYLHILPTLYLIVVIRSCFLFEWPGRLVVASLSLLMFLVHQGQFLHKTTQFLPPVEQHQLSIHQLAEVLMFVLGLFLVLQLVNILLVEQKTRSHLAVAHEKLQLYILQAEDLAILQERNRIARDIHDSLGHALMALNVQMQTAARFWSIDLDRAKEFFTQAQRLGEMAMQEVRQSVSMLREPEQKARPLEEEIRSLVADFRHDTGISPTTKIDLRASVPPPMAKTLYRIVQEALTNICKYAQAQEVKIHLIATNNSVCLSIEDDGRGFSLNQKITGFGLLGMQERVAADRGRFDIKTSPGSGCRIAVEFPLSQEPT